MSKNTPLYVMDTSELSQGETVGYGGIEPRFPFVFAVGPASDLEAMTSRGECVSRPRAAT